ncbi:hypothetical protein MAR_016751 [Mya arenaria]|uniref:Uncharacterized protein n=1 Tax=Mya arenaria TaxID=6604 RepID=A0ABY7E9X1_MYAAR|nr:hypothetical protein MAR_016751 [Mya arenaria]
MNHVEGFMEVMKLELFTEVKMWEVDMVGMTEEILVATAEVLAVVQLAEAREEEALVGVVEVDVELA